MEEWKSYKLGDLYGVHNGLSKSAQYFGSGFPFLSFSSVFKNYFLPEQLDSLVESSEREQQRFSIHRGDVFITRTSETAEELGMSSVALKAYPRATYNGFTKRLRPVHGESFVYPEFIGYYLRSPQFRNHFYALTSSMSTRASLANGDLLAMEVMLPSISEQKRISRILLSLDLKIALNNRINHNLEEQAKALYKSWFVDFEPFKGGRFVDSELGLIPEGWNILPLGQIIEYQKKSINPQRFPDTVFFHYSLPAFDNSKEPEIQSGAEIMSNKFVVEDQMVLFSKLNPRIKRLWVLDNVQKNSVCSTEFIAYSALNHALFPYIWCYLNGDLFYDGILSMVNGATGSHQRFHAEDTLGFILPFNQEVAFSFSKLIAPFMYSIIKNERENRSLKQEREVLLPRMMNGALHFSD